MLAVTDDGIERSNAMLDIRATDLRMDGEAERLVDQLHGSFAHRSGQCGMGKQGVRRFSEGEERHATTTQGPIPSAAATQ